MKSNLTSGGVLRIGVALVVVLALVGGGLAYFVGGFGHKASASTSEHESDEVKEAVITLNTVYPRYGKSFSLTQKRPADVRPYYEASLETRVPGIVDRIDYDVGFTFKKGEVLVRVSVPDQAALVKQRGAEVKRAESQVEQKQAGIETAEADVVAANAKIKAAEARRDSDVAYHTFRKLQADRYSNLLAERAIDAKLVDEQMDRLEAAREAVIASTAQVAYANAEVVAAKARVKQATADLAEAKAKVEVTKAQLTFAKVMLDYATIVAPFDGQITRRNVDPGFFVQNAGDGHATPLLVVQRNDIVTITVGVPDVYASYITRDTEIIFETPNLPGLKIHGKVTRFPDSLVNARKDRTMLVEIDLWNRSAAEFDKKKKDKVFLNDLKKDKANDPVGVLPVVPKMEGKLPPGRQKQLMPGMFGELTLILHDFENVHLLPSSAIVTMGGFSYIYVVENDKARLQPISVQINDGKLAKVELVTNEGESLGDLRGTEQVIVSNQGELTEGAAVKPTVVDDWKQLNAGHDKNEKKE